MKGSSTTTFTQEGDYQEVEGEDRGRGGEGEYHVLGDGIKQCQNSNGSYLIQKCMCKQQHKLLFYNNTFWG